MMDHARRRHRQFISVLGSLIAKGVIGWLHNPRARPSRCSLSVIGFLHDPSSQAHLVQNTPPSQAEEERKNRA